MEEEEWVQLILGILEAELEENPLEGHIIQWENWEGDFDREVACVPIGAINI